MDLTSEFGEPLVLRQGREYLCLPVLDNAAPEREAFREVVQRVADCEGGVYVHCALGHGRSALVVASVVMARGVAGSAEEALVLVRQARLGVRLNRAQRAFLEDWREHGM